MDGETISGVSVALGMYAIIIEMDGGQYEIEAGSQVVIYKHAIRWLLRA